jgi:plasmid stabilization system protein ParE
MAKIRWTAESEKWMREIYDYIARENEGAAKRVITGIYGKVQILGDFPEIGHKYRSEPEGDVRILLYGHYRIAYLVRNKEFIDVLGIFHGAMEMDRYLKILE